VYSFASEIMVRFLFVGWHCVRGYDMAVCSVRGTTELVP
jgi:hypothetical protein